MAADLPTGDEALARVAALEAELARVSRELDTVRDRERATREVLSVIGRSEADP
jgi:hypothetical protein